MQRRLRFFRKGKSKVIAGFSGQAGPVTALGFVNIINLTVLVGKGFFMTF